MEAITVKDYFENGNNILEIELNNKYHIYIDNMSLELCIELCDRSGNSVNIGSYVNIHYLTVIDDIKDIVIDYLIGNYLYNYI